AERFDLGPPHAAMAQADAILIERLGDDDVIDFALGEVALLGQPAHAGPAAGLFIGGAGDFERAGEFDARRQDRLDRDHAGSQAAFHVRGAAAVNLAVFQFAAPRIDAPAIAGFDHVDMRVEMHARPRAFAFDPRHHIGARIFVAIGFLGGSARIFDAEAFAAQPLADQP